MRPASAPLASLVDLLARHRMALFIIYVAAVLLVGTGIYSLSIVGLPSLFDYIVPGRDPEDISSWGGPFPAEAIGFLAVLIVFQALFLFGGGRIPVREAGRGIWRTVVPVAVAGAALVIVVTSMAYALAEMFDRANGDGSIRESAILDVNGLEIDWQFLAWLAAMWIVWMVVALIAFRGGDRHSTLRKLTAILLAGSWIEFLVALPVDIAIRQRADSCSCATGSWIALVFAIPVMLFAFGPALYLLYLREVELGRASPGRAMRILLHKSRRDRDSRDGDAT